MSLRLPPASATASGNHQAFVRHRLQHHLLAPTQACCRPRSGRQIKTTAVPAAEQPVGPLQVVRGRVWWRYVDRLRLEDCQLRWACQVCGLPLPPRVGAGQPHRAGEHVQRAARALPAPGPAVLPGARRRRRCTRSRPTRPRGQPEVLANGTPLNQVLVATAGRLPDGCSRSTGRSQPDPATTGNAARPGTTRRPRACPRSRTRPVEPTSRAPSVRRAARDRA